MPIQIPINNEVYTKDEIDQLIFPKADKVDGAIDQNIAGLTGDEGNLLDTGYNICDLVLGEVIDAGTF